MSLYDGCNCSSCLTRAQRKERQCKCPDHVRTREASKKRKK